MSWLPVVAYFFGVFFLVNVVPHVVSGTMGRPFQSLFARPPGAGLSSSIINVIWGFFNIVFGYLLACRVGDFQIRNTADATAMGIGALLIILFPARHFVRFNSGHATKLS